MKKKVATWAAAPLSVLAILGGAWAYVMRDPAPDLSDMEPPPRDVAPADDAFPLLVEAAKANDPDRIAEALKRPKLMVPDGAFDADTEWLELWSRLAMSARGRTRWTLGAGDSEAALAEALEIVELGHRIVLARGATFSVLHVGRKIEQIGLERVRELACRGGLARDSLARAIATLDAAREPDSVLEDAWKVELRMVERMIDDVEHGRRTPASLGVEDELDWRFRVGWTFRPNATIALFASTYRKGVAMARERVHGKALPAPPPALDHLEKRDERNSVGRSLHRRHDPSLERIHLRRCDADLALDATRVALALREFKDQTGSQPDELDELVPRWLPSVPLDPIDGRPLRWSAESSTLLCKRVERLVSRDDDPAPSNDFHLLMK